MKIIQEREVEEGVEHRLEFSYRAGDRNLDGGGCSFPATADGDLDWEEMATRPEAMINLNRCLMGELTFVGHTSQPWEYYPPRIGLCCCGEEVYLDRFTNACECGRDYNSAGQELAPRSQWGEETGESYADICDL